MQVKKSSHMAWPKKSKKKVKRRTVLNNREEQLAKNASIWASTLILRPGRSWTAQVWPGGANLMARSKNSVSMIPLLSNESLITCNRRHILYGTWKIFISGRSNSNPQCPSANEMSGLKPLWISFRAREMSKPLKEDGMAEDQDPDSQYEDVTVRYLILVPCL